MLYVSNPVADKLKPLLICSDFGIIIIPANRKCYWARNTRNNTIEEGYTNYAYERVWKHTYKVNFFRDTTCKDKVYQHIHKDKIAQIIISSFKFNNAFMNKDEEDESENDYVPYELAGVYDYD